VTQIFKVYHIICRNNEHSSAAKLGKRSKKYIGYWCLNDYVPVETIYYDEKPHCIARYSIRTGKVYGYSPLTQNKKGFQSLEGMFFLAIAAAGRMADKRMGYFDIGQIGALELDSDAKYVPFNQGIVGSGSAPIFPIEDVGDITPLFQAIRPIILNSLRGEYKLDAMAEYFQQQRGNPRTATEVLAIQTIKNKMIAPQVKRLAEQLFPFRYRATMIILRDMARDENYDMDPEVRKSIMRNDPGLFKIDETSVVKRIIYTEKAEQFSADLQLIGAALQVQPSLMTAVELYDPLKNVLDHGGVTLRDRDEYEEKRDAVEAMQMQQGVDQTRAMNAQADAIAEGAM